MTLYALKPRFQALLRPLVKRLAQAGVTANQITLLAGALSLLLGAILCAWPERRGLFLLLPLWLLLRMAFNAVDGMLAREFGQKSRLGGYLNELCDVAADAALIAPFAFVAPFNPIWIAAVILLAALSEYAGVMGPLIGASRRYDGPFGKSDRALVFGALGIWAGASPSLPEWAGWMAPVMAALLVWTILNRVRGGLGEL
ncbi:CDP-alcohol phosphatidyltransferase family protein [Terrarubrum flagellatum]|uniref:CDP-alcohol phosphatidyltransferase family protein n=1 Tax=Terrirubrum flagellatum TaxID=2895980 RepID=UPI003144D8B1